MRRSAYWAAAGAALVVIAATEAAAARGGNDGDGHLRRQMHDPSLLEPRPDADRRAGPGAGYDAYRRGGAIDGEWYRKHRR